MNAIDGLEGARALLVAQPFNGVIGARIDAFEPGRAQLSLAIAPHHLQQQGVVHGGVLAYLADNTLTYAAGSVLGSAVMTAGFRIDYLRPALAVGHLVATAEVTDHTRSQAVCRCDVFHVAEDGTRRLCAAAQGTVRRIDTAARGLA
jgi:uncharacterized protein (TIGR00369 family)